MRQWRLMYDYPTDGQHNMAIDEAILTSVGAGNSPPTLRLYRWDPPCISLGYGQKAVDVDFERAALCDWDVVRRPTGGRAILHTDELTYSVALPVHEDLAAGSIIDSYRRISGALVVGLEMLGLTPEADRRAERGIASGPVCFETPSHYEITFNGRKLVGSAQMRRQTGLLQHGSLPLCGDVTRLCDALVYPDETAREQAKKLVRARAITLEDALGQRIEWQSAADAITQGFASMFDIDFTVSVGLSEDEHILSEQLTAEVYGYDGWTRRH